MRNQNPLVTNDEWRGTIREGTALPREAPFAPSIPRFRVGKQSLSRQPKPSPGNRFLQWRSIPPPPLPSSRAEGIGTGCGDVIEWMLLAKSMPA